MKKLITILIAVLMLASVFSAVTATASLIEFSIVAKLRDKQVQVDLNVKGAAGKGICVFGPLVIGFDNTKLQIPYQPAGGISNIEDTNYQVGNGTANTGYEAITVSDDCKSIKILYADAKDRVIAGDGTVLSIFFEIKTGAADTVSFTLSASDKCVVGNSNGEEFDFYTDDYSQTISIIPTHKTSLKFSDDKNTGWNSDMTELNIISGNSRQIYAKIYDHMHVMFISDVTDKSEWVSDKKSIAIVEKGLITAVSEGMAIISAMYNNETISIIVIVTNDDGADSSTNDSSGVKTTTIAANSGEEPVPPTGIAAPAAFLIFAAAACAVLVKTKKS